MRTTPLKPSAGRILFVEILCCAFLKSHLALNAFTFVLNESGGIVFSESGAPLKGTPSPPKLAQDVRPWLASSSTAEGANRNTASCQDSGTTLRSRPGADGRPPAKFSEAALLLGSHPGSVLASSLERGDQSSDDP